MAYDKVTEEYDQNGKLTKTTKERQVRKTFWYWLQLLIIPLVIVFLGIGFTSVQNQTSNQIAQANRNQDLQIAKDNRQNDLNIADDQRQETELQTYLDRMTELLLTGNIHDPKIGVDARNLARARTLTTLRRLDAERKSIVLRFLSYAGLINKDPSPIVNLAGADLMGADLKGFEPGGADLADVDLTNANLSNSNLSSDYLAGANLTGAILTEANLSFAQLSNPRHQPPEFANLSGANLTGANLIGTDLSGVNVTKVIWKNTTCPDRISSDTKVSGSCVGH